MIDEHMEMCVTYERAQRCRQYSSGAPRSVRVDRETASAIERQQSSFQKLAQPRPAPRRAVLGPLCARRSGPTVLSDSGRRSTPSRGGVGCDAAATLRRRGQQPSIPTRRPSSGTNPRSRRHVLRSPIHGGRRVRLPASAAHCSLAASSMSTRPVPANIAWCNWRMARASICAVPPACVYFTSAVNAACRCSAAKRFSTSCRMLAGLSACTRI